MRKCHIANGYHFDKLTYFFYSLLFCRMHKKSIICWYPFVRVQVHQFVNTQTTNILNRKWAPLLSQFSELAYETADANVLLSCFAFDQRLLLISLLYKWYHPSHSDRNEALMNIRIYINVSVYIRKYNLLKTIALWEPNQPRQRLQAICRNVLRRWRHFLGSYCLR